MTSDGERGEHGEYGRDGRGRRGGRGEGDGRGGADRTGALSAFAGLLGEAGDYPPTGREIAELLWLARHTDPAGSTARHTAVLTSDHVPRFPPKNVFTAADKPAKPVPPRTGPSGPSGPSGAPAPEPPAAGSRVPLHAPATGSCPVTEERPAHAALLAPAPPMLAGPLALQRALRPLRRTVPATDGWELDEAATADRIAALGPGRRLWLPVLRPRRERWLHLRIVYDSGPTMAIWRPLVRELHTALAQTGAFRTLDVLPLGADGRLPLRHRERGRTAVLVISDAMGPQWRDGPAGLRWRAALAGLAAEMPVALLQPLPERLWRHTAAPAVPGRFAAPAAGVPNTGLGFTPYDTGRLPAGVPVPVLEPSDVWLGHWAALVASVAGAEVPGAAAFVTPAAPEPPEDALVPRDADPEELVLRFRALASPEAFRLAAHLAVGPAHLPVMRLVQAAVERRPEPRHLAEVVLSGMLVAPGDAAPGAYDFRPGVREVLLTALPRTSLVATARLLARVSAEIEARAGALPGEFRALVECLAGQGGERAVGRPFALVSEESVRLLGGPERTAGRGPGVRPPDGNDPGPPQGPPSQGPPGDPPAGDPPDPPGPRAARVVYGLLGPPRAVVGDEDATAVSYGRDAFLCRLLMARGQPVGEPELRAATAGSPAEEPRARALRLRGLGHPVELLDGAFRLAVGPEALDLLRAEALAEQAAEALGRGDRAAARQALGSALVLWYGEPLDGVPGAWAAQERDTLRAFREELAGQAAALDAPSPSARGVLLLRRRAGTPAVPNTLITELDGLLRGRLGVLSFGRVQPHSDGSIRAALSPGLDAAALVAWAVREFPEALASGLPADAAAPVRVDVVVHDGTEAAGVSLAAVGREPTLAETEAALLIVTVLVSHRVRAGLPRGLRRRFGTVVETAEGWQHVVVVERPPV